NGWEDGRSSRLRFNLIRVLSDWKVPRTNYTNSKSWHSQEPQEPGSRSGIVTASPRSVGVPAFQKWHREPHRVACPLLRPEIAVRGIRFPATFDPSGDHDDRNPRRPRWRASPVQSIRSHPYES